MFLNPKQLGNLLRWYVCVALCVYSQPEDLHNPHHEAFYRAQGIVQDQEDMQKMLQAFKTPLPVSFRVNGLGAFAEALRDQIKHDLFSQLERSTTNSGSCIERLDDGSISVDGEILEPPKQLPWYPDGLAWQLNYSRGQLRKLPALKSVHEFLKTANDFGSITRQVCSACSSAFLVVYSLLKPQLARMLRRLGHCFTGNCVNDSTLASEHQQQ